MNKGELYVELMETKDKMLKMYSSMKLDKGAEITKEQKEILKPITLKYEDLDKRVKDLKAKEEADEEAEELAQAKPKAVALPEETAVPAKEEISTKKETFSAPVSEAKVKKNEVIKASLGTAAALPVEDTD